MITHIQQKFYRSNATQLSESDIKEIRESRGKVPNASKRMAKKFHIGARRVYEIWEHNERLQQGLDSWDDSPPSDSHNKKLSAIEISINEASTKVANNIKSKPKLIHNSDQSSFSKGSIDNVNRILKTKKETILPEISQETENPLELFKRIQKDAKKSRAVARADISKLSIAEQWLKKPTLNSKV
ncbi:10911_t:CDS:1 [Ambispora gerdemannii]|uniref:10911_t:CDS:1 n=1 Tax=Ambispora gerdemannii TaxID=144530 RepID=A0A9N9A845_9GLOM|nr:10911_t:CDS:1 [Ambispora gerdemannii]